MSATLALTSKLLLAAAPGAAIVTVVGEALNRSEVENIVLVVVVVLAGLMTLRTSVAKIWRENYEAEVEKTKVLEVTVAEEREKKHNALNDAATARNLLLIEQSKTDLSPLMLRLEEHTRILQSIADSLSSRP